MGTHKPLHHDKVKTLYACTHIHTHTCSHAPTHTHTHLLVCTQLDDCKKLPHLQPMLGPHTLIQRTLQTVLNKYWSSAKFILRSTNLSLSTIMRAPQSPINLYHSSIYGTAIGFIYHQLPNPDLEFTIEVLFGTGKVAKLYSYSSGSWHDLIEPVNSRSTVKLFNL